MIRTFRNLSSYIRTLLSRDRLDNDLDEEIKAHLELEARKHVLLGLPQHEAIRRANIALGGRSRTIEECRDVHGIWIIENLWKDCTHALRMFLRSPAFASTVVFTIAIVVGVNSIVFGFCRAVLLSTLPVPNPNQLRLVCVNYPGATTVVYFSFPDLKQMQNASSETASITGFSEVVDYHLRDDAGTTSTIKGQLVAGNFFSLLQISPLMGRPLTQDDNRPGAQAVAAISFRFWQTRFGGVGSVVGRQLSIQQKPVTVVAVMPRGFDGVEPGARPDVWMPLSMQSAIGYQGYASMNDVDSGKPWLGQDGVSWIHILARSSNGDRLHAALTRLIKAQVAEQLPHVNDPEQRAVLLGATASLTSAAGGLPRLREQFSLPLQILFGLAGVLLFNGCVNIVNLVLARSRTHQHETAIRLSLGSSRIRLMAHRVTETLLLAFVGGVLSLPLTIWGSRVILHWLVINQNLQIDFDPGSSMFNFTMLITMLAGFVVSVVPQLQIADMTMAGSLGQRSQMPVDKGGHTSRSSSILIGSQLALSVASLVIAGLLSHTLLNYARLNLGIDRDHVLSIGIDPSAGGYTTASRLNALYRRLTTMINRLPGVVSSSVGGCGLMGGGCATMNIAIEGEVKRTESPFIERNYVGADYFSTVGMGLLRGREIQAYDTLDSRRVGVVNDEFERRYLRGQSAMSRFINVEGQKVQIVGVVKDARSDDIHNSAMPYLYQSVEQAVSGWNISHVEVRTKGDPMAIANSVRAAILSADRAIPVAEIVTLGQETNRGLARELLVGRLGGVFSVLTLIIAAVGLYGVLAYSVSQRRTEFALRMALGATRQAVMSMVFKQASLIWICGCAGGLGLAVLSARVVSSLLFETGALDMWAYSGALVALFVVSLIAALLPAWRAASVDPASTLRGD